MDRGELFVYAGYFAANLAVPAQNHFIFNHHLCGLYGFNAAFFGLLKEKKKVEAWLKKTSTNFCKIKESWCRTDF